MWTIVLIVVAVIVIPTVIWYLNIYFQPYNSGARAFNTNPNTVTLNQHQFGPACEEWQRGYVDAHNKYMDRLVGHGK
jgi:hypothetical protein